ncbi:DEKNAAC103523 [Brettanomyces naardenensis]|uniref:DEKNAAC103523 n=1 Tax=Brettanomyces naardenensis TaxID=13370 RepID=A0A448YNV1_BRENA|nr:DEKNAAC103523 [Brettanomyces naardenensis]
MNATRPQLAQSQPLLPAPCAPSLITATSSSVPSDLLQYSFSRRSIESTLSSSPVAAARVRLPSIHALLADSAFPRSSSQQLQLPNPIALPLPQRSQSTPSVIDYSVVHPAHLHQQQPYAYTPLYRHADNSVSSTNSSSASSPFSMSPAYASSDVSATTTANTTTTEFPTYARAESYDGVSKPSPSSSRSSSPNLSRRRSNSVPRKRRASLPKRTTAILLNWLNDNLDHPYPNSSEKADMLRMTGLTNQQLSNWFINARRRKIQLLRDIKNGIKQ